jgi:hypothetical protein
VAAVPGVLPERLMLALSAVGDFLIISNHLQRWNRGIDKAGINSEKNKPPISSDNRGLRLALVA